MRRFIVCLAFLAFCGSTVAVEESKEAKQLQKATNVFNEIMGIPEKGIPQEILEKAVCVGIVPSEIKVALGIGGAYGRGVLVCRKGGNGTWGAPSMFTLGGANIGFQIGGKATDVVFVVMNSAGVQKLVEDSVKLGADLSAAAGPVGRSAAAETDVQLHAEILSYSRARGLFAGVSLEGAVLKQDHDDNEHLYGRKVEAKDILIQGTVPLPAAARPLNEALTKYAAHGGEPFAKT